VSQPSNASWVAPLATLSAARLEELASTVKNRPAERLAAASLLWERGEHARLRSLASGDRLLTAKLEALEAARPNPGRK